MNSLKFKRLATFDLLHRRIACGKTAVRVANKMSLYRYFAKSSKFPDPDGELSPSVSPAATKEASEAVRSVTIMQAEIFSKKKEALLPSPTTGLSHYEKR